MRGLSLDELPRGAAGMSALIAEHLAAGRSLEQVDRRSAIARRRCFAPRLLAGLRSGRLAESLEATATAARRMSELRQSVGLSLVYPTILVCMGLLEVPLLAKVLSVMIDWMRVGRDDIPGWLHYFEAGPIGSSAGGSRFRRSLSCF